MKPLNFSLRLLKQVGILVFRVEGILLPAVLGLAHALASRTGKADNDTAVVMEYEDGTPYYEATEHTHWQAHYGER